MNLWLHDLGNLNLQLLWTSDDKEMLEAIADNINFLIGKSGHGEQFLAEVLMSETNQEGKVRD